MIMKFPIFFTLLQATRTTTAANGIHLRQTTPAIPNVFDSVVEVLNQCTNETDALAECYDGYGIMETCGECAWTRILNEMNEGCIDINEIAPSIYKACIDTKVPTATTTAMMKLSPSGIVPGPCTVLILTRIHVLLVMSNIMDVSLSSQLSK
jgi:hypothetical protein